ncbi:MAG: hypothetical protein K0R54_1926 [Clostridiaceae bacterium]|nr:hypothetical protein [Clostridiaceae bacterium]
MEDKRELNSLLFKDSIFPLIVGIACAAIFAGTHMYIVYHTGAFNEIYIVQMLDKGLKGGDYAAAAGFSTGFLLARILEGPLVGILDIGGSLLTGVGIGIPALMMASGIQAPIKSFPLALLTGLGIGVVIGLIIILIRKLVPNGIAAGGTDIMMGAGNATGRYLGPLIMLSAIQYGIPTGIGAIIGGAIFYKLDRPIAGGAILGAMIAGGIFIK